MHFLFAKDKVYLNRTIFTYLHTSKSDYNNLPKNILQKKLTGLNIT